MEDTKIRNIKNYETKLYLILVEELADGARWLPYGKLAEKLGCSWSTVTRNVGKLMESDLIGYSDGKLYLK